MRNVLLMLGLMAGAVSCSSALDRSEATPKATLRPATKVVFPHETDCNSPAWWAAGQLGILNSAGHPWRSTGKDLVSLANPQKIEYDNTVNGGRWIEAIWQTGGSLYGYYHIEPGGLAPGTTLTAPKIGAAKSTDNGRTWKDLGIIMEADPATFKLDARNGYFIGGHGDFCVYLDQDEKVLYIYYGNYGGDVSEQGVAVARLKWEDRDQPVGKVQKWYQGKWSEPGLRGKLTPIWPGFVAWEREDCNAFWGPSIHWNTHLQCYVMLLNRSKAKGWVQDGIYVSFAKQLGDTKAWSKPVKILEGGAWYPQVMGLEPGGTDKLAGRAARFFMAGVSEREIVFER
ncbi:MAG: hypothetical protein NTU53_19815 [Planctomycetota bacterium]|nr:hypothetical protein [Planctomycetota bacterium]